MLLERCGVKLIAIIALAVSAAWGVIASLHIGTAFDSGVIALYGNPDPPPTPPDGPNPPPPPTRNS